MVVVPRRSTRGADRDQQRVDEVGGECGGDAIIWAGIAMGVSNHAPFFNPSFLEIGGYRELV